MLTHGPSTSEVNQTFSYSGTERKEDLKSRIYCPKYDQLCCAMMIKHIFEVWYVFFISCFYMVIIYSGENYYMYSLRTTSAFDIFVWTSCNHGNEK